VIASANSRQCDGWAGARRAFGIVVLAALVTGCSSFAAPPPRSALEPLPTLSSRVPDRADHLVHDATAASLADDLATLDRAVATLAELERTRLEEAGVPSGLVPYAFDLRNATTNDPLEYEAGCRELLERDDLDPALRHRLEAIVNDDERLLADERISDAREARFGRIFNALVEPVGRSIVNGVMLPWRLARSISGLIVRERMEDDLSLQERQALAYWKEFVENHPEQADAQHLLSRIDESQQRWYETRRDQYLRRARRALKRGEDAAAVLLAERALSYVPEDAAASELRDTALERLEAERARMGLSLAADDDTDLRSGRPLLLALLVGTPDAIAQNARELQAADASAELSDEVSFAEAVAEREAGHEAEAWEHFEEVARGRDSSNMARHAWAILANPDENPYRFYRGSRNRELNHQMRWLAFGPLARGPADRDLPDPVEWMIDLPGLPSAVMGFPNRLIRFPWAKPRSNAPAVYAHRYLKRYPRGIHADELRHWLVSYESGEEHFVTAAALAAQDPETDPDELAELREKAAHQALQYSERVPRRDVRVSMLRRVTSDYPDTEAARDAARALRTELVEGTPQRIRVSREYLLEHPQVAGPEGLALRPELLDGELDNGELHPDGVTLLGGRMIELDFVDEDGRERGDPVRRRQMLSEERLARIVAMLEEASLRDVLVDPDLPPEPDPDRDQFFERVRLGLTDEPDTRATAQSTYTFQGTQERYGLVRQRESVLPMDLVFQVSGGDLGLGAFPRMRAPRETPDAILYR
jgi:hypothetical protein